MGLVWQMRMVVVDDWMRLWWDGCSHISQYHWVCHTPIRNFDDLGVSSHDGLDSQSRRSWNSWMDTHLFNKVLIRWPFQYLSQT